MLFRRSLAASVVAVAAGSAFGQCETFGPRGASFRASQAVTYDQVWSQVARTSAGYVAVWSAGQDVVLRRFDANLAPIGNDTLVNATLNVGIQDEPAVAVAVGGNQLVAWSERNGYDGQLMGIYGRVYNAAGTPLAAEFRINQITVASQWRPLIARTPAGGFVVTWSGDWDGNAYFRVLSASGTPLTNDVLINQYTIDAQVDPAVAVASDGRIFAVYVDFSSGTSVDGLDLYGRLFNASGAALSNEFLITTPAFTVGHQSLPRVAVDGANRFIVAWQSEGTDGSSTAIVGRRFDVNAAPLGGEFIVNGTRLGAQLEPRVAAESDGDFVVSFEDYSTGIARAACRRFDGLAQPKGPDAFVDPTMAGTYRPEVIVDAGGADTVFAFESWGGADADVYLRRFQASPGVQSYCSAKLTSQGCLPELGFTGAPSGSSASPFVISATNAVGSAPGQFFYGYDSAFLPFQGGTLCVQGPVRAPLQVTAGSVAACSGVAGFDFNAWIQSGIDPALVPGTTVGIQFYFRDAADPAGFGSGLSNALRFTICP